MKLMRLLVLFALLLLLFTGCRIEKYPPELISLSPAEAYVDQEVVLTGYQFGPDPIVTVGRSSSAIRAEVLSSDDNTIRIRVPVAPPGQTVLNVTNSQGMSAPLPFTVRQPAPVLANLSPGNGLPGTVVTLTGAYLNQVKTLRFNDAVPIIRDSTDTKIVFVVPNNLPRGPIDLFLETKGGQLLLPFIVAGTPQITGLSVRTVRPGGELIVRGSNLTDGVVRINGAIVDAAQTSVKDTEIRTVVPTNATSGRVTVTVFNSLTAISPDSLLIVQQPIIGSVSQREGIQGDRLIVTGTSLRDVQRVTLGQVGAPFRVLSDTQLEVTVPGLGAVGEYVVSVSSVGGTARNEQTFFYYVAPSNLTVQPARQLRGRFVTITGTNLYRPTEVRINGKMTSISDKNDGVSILIQLPDDATSGVVSVSNRAGTATTAGPLVVVQPPVVTDIIPLKARPGERVVVRGDFLLNAQILFSGTTAAAADGGRMSDTERWVLVPNTAQTGPIRLTNEAGETTTTAAFTAIRLVSQLSFTPTSAAVGEVVTISGQNLASVTEVRFGSGTSSAATFRLSGTNLLVTVPANATTGQICLTNDAGTACTTGNLTVR